MNNPAKILALAGSARRDSINKKLLAIGVAGARAAGAQVTELDLAHYPLPLYDGDLEAKDGLPGNALKLKAIFTQHDGLLLACPEYNSSITPLLKNTIDWVSRPAGADEPMLAAYRGKTAALLAASPGALGGLRGLVHVRAILGNIGVLVLPGQIAVPKAHEVFDEAGNLTDDRRRTAVEALGAELAKAVARLAS